VFQGLYIDSDRNVTLKEDKIPPLGESQVRIRTEFAAVKHGTEFTLFSGESPFERHRFDSDLRLFVPRDEEQQAKSPAPPGGRFAGNTAVGVVTEVGPGVTAFQPGDRVYAYGAACEVLTKAESAVHLLDPPLTATDAVCIDPAIFALGAVRDGRVGLGDNVVVFGLGAIGLLVVQMVRLAGCLGIVAVDPIEKRRTLAQEFGAGLTLDPTSCDIAREVRRYLGRGADIAIEASGSYKALAQAMRSVQQCARVVTIGYYRGKDTEMELGMEWHHNRLEMICSLPAWGNPPRDYPVWTERRLHRTAEELFRRRALLSESIVDPVVDFADSARAFLEVYQNPAQAIKLGMRFPT
jgi:threonine dehydrogenase-like Zn-dependent dehydrogenase